MTLSRDEVNKLTSVDFSDEAWEDVEIVLEWIRKKLEETYPLPTTFIDHRVAAWWRNFWGKGDTIPTGEKE